MLIGVNLGEGYFGKCYSELAMPWACRRVELLSTSSLFVWLQHSRPELKFRSQSSSALKRTLVNSKSKIILFMLK